MKAGYGSLTNGPINSAEFSSPLKGERRIPAERPASYNPG